jgi:hypothetical protein
VIDQLAVAMTAEDAATLHQMASRVLQAWGDERGPHVDRVTAARRRLESALRGAGWRPSGEDHGAWVRDPRPARGGRR